MKGILVRETYEKCCKLLGFNLVDERKDSNVLLMCNYHYKNYKNRKSEVKGGKDMVVVKDAFVL